MKFNYYHFHFYQLYFVLFKSACSFYRFFFLLVISMSPFKKTYNKTFINHEIFFKWTYFQTISTTEAFPGLSIISIDFCSGSLFAHVLSDFFECEAMFSGILPMGILCNLDEVACLHRRICFSQEWGHYQPVSL